MTVIRNTLAFEERYARIPNVWLRDKRISYKALGVLAHILSHRNGWNLTLGSMAQNVDDEADNREGRAAIRTAIAELRAAGYLVTRQKRDPERHTFGEAEYELRDPFEPLCDYPTTGFPVDGLSDSGSSNTKKTSVKEDQSSEDQRDIGGEGLFDIEPVAEPAIDWFASVWEHWPKKDNRASSIKLWPKAVKASKMSEQALASRLVEHANAYRAHRLKSYTPALDVFLRNERWGNDLVEPNGTVSQPGPARPPAGSERARGALDAAARVQARMDAQAAEEQKGIES